MMIKKAAKENFASIAELMARMNQKNENRCAYLGTSEIEIEEYLNEVYEENEPNIFYIEKENRVIGAIAGDLCPDNHTIEVLGPFIEETMEQREESGSQLVEQLSQQFPQFYLSFFVDAKNQFIEELVQSMDGKPSGEDYVMYYDLRKEPHTSLKPRKYNVFQAGQDKVATQIEALHNRLFPGAYSNGRTILEHVDEEHWLIYCMNYEKAASYAYFNAEEDGYLEFIGTNPDERNQGYATSLLQGIAALLSKHGCRQIQLCVSANDSEAIQLYHSFGFKTEEHNKSYRMIR